MAEVIQFNCPACGTTLRLPLAMAAQHGPCPTCDREIVAPDPYRGLGAYEATFALAPPEPEPFRAFADSPPLVPKEPEIAPAPPVPTPPEEPVTSEPAPPEVVPDPLPVAPSPVFSETHAAPESRKTILVLSCLLAGAVGLAMGYAFGVRSTRIFTADPPFTSPAAAIQKQEKPEPSPVPVVQAGPTATPAQEPQPEVKTAHTPEPAPIPVQPVIDASKIEKPAPPVKVSDAAEASLRAFLDAPDWAARNAHVLFPDVVRSAMETYSHEVPDGPTPYKSISVAQSSTDEKTGDTLFIFYVVTETFPTGIPVAVTETPQGWLVDWQSFVEFRDDQFKKFADGPADRTQRFHLTVRPPPPARAATTENEHFSSFLLDPPFPDRQQLAFVKKNSEAYATCHAATESGVPLFAVLETTKRTTPDGQGYLEILKVTATDWLPREK